MKEQVALVLVFGWLSLMVFSVLNRMQKMNLVWPFDYNLPIFAFSFPSC